MAKRLLFSGYSDDTFGCREIDHDNCANGKPIIFRVSASGGEDSLLVWGHYAPAGTPAAGWVVGVVNDDGGLEEKPIPAWPMMLRAGETPYSPTLVIEAPDDVVVTHVAAEV